MQKTTIYVELLDEGTIVFAPVPAAFLEKNYYQILEPEKMDDYLLRFKPGTYVYCLSSKFSGDENLVSVAYCEIDESLIESLQSQKAQN